MLATLTDRPRWTRLVAVPAALWYGFGLWQAALGYAADAAAAPLLIWVAYAAACLAGIVGSAMLALAPSHASRTFAISLVCAAAYFGWVFAFGAPAGEDFGIGAVVIAVTGALTLASRRL
ncbi:MAG: hypothetical protein AAFU61_08690 [Pseudomonadota bacterium]